MTIAYGATTRFWVGAFALAITGSCVDTRPLESRGTDEGECYSCHGDPSLGHAAPPPAIWRDQPVFDAHSAHLAPSDWHRDLSCEQCHLVPDELDSVGHIDSARPAELTWGELVSEGGADPAWDGTRCGGTYCHGTTLIEGGTNTEPVWTSVGTGEAECGSCHSRPPVDPHPDADDCATCHPTVDEGQVFVDRTRHIDGVVDFSETACGICHGIPPEFPHPDRDDCSTCHPNIDENGDFVDPALHDDGVIDVLQDCNLCHGNDTNDAPPFDVARDEATTATGVGAHQSHLGPSDWHTEVLCSACHDVPDAAGDAGHIDAVRPADVDFSDVAVAGGASPDYRGDRGCAAVYCHGSTLSAGGSIAAPDWTRVDGSQAECGACHDIGARPRDMSGMHDKHVRDENVPCSGCHGNVTTRGDFLDPDEHIDGVLQIDVTGGTVIWDGNSCSGTCHGDRHQNEDWYDD